MFYERKYCDANSESRIFYLRKVIIIIVIIVCKTSEIKKLCEINIKIQLAIRLNFNSYPILFYKKMAALSKTVC